jgi:2'-hydroxybiphenyl-2-sulfinate desulfinase
MPKEKEIHYTICPVGNSSFIAAKKNWLQEELARLEVTPVRLQTLPQSFWSAHFDYHDPLLFREGGNAPPIWAKSNDAEVVLIGLTLLEQKQYILTLADSPVDSVEELRGHRLGIPVSVRSPIDVSRAWAQHGFEIALAARGVALGEVTFVELPVDVDLNKEREAREKTHIRDVEQNPEILALNAGKVDAVYEKSTTVGKLLDSGKYKVIFDLAQDPDLVLPVTNEYPNVLTVSRHLADDFPEVVVAYVKQLLRAAEWAKTHRREVLELFADQTYGTIQQTAASHSFDFHKRLAPEFSEKTLLALESQKRFLFDHGYLKKDFALEKWADDRFLKAALAEFRKEAGQSRDQLRLVS